MAKNVSLCFSLKFILWPQCFGNWNLIGRIKFHNGEEWLYIGSDTIKVFSVFKLRIKEKGNEVYNVLFFRLILF